MSDLTASAVRISLPTVVIVPPMRKVGRFPLERWKSDAFLVTISRKYWSNAGIGWNKAGPMPRTDGLRSGNKWMRRWDGSELKRRRKGDRKKVKVARRLRRETTMTLNWRAQRLKMGRVTMIAPCVNTIIS